MNKYRIDVVNKYTGIVVEYFYVECGNIESFIKMVQVPINCIICVTGVK